MTSLPADSGVPLGYRFVQPTPNVVEHPETQAHDLTIAYSASYERHRTSWNAREQGASWRSVQLRSRRLQVRALSGAPDSKGLSRKATFALFRGAILAPTIGPECPPRGPSPPIPSSL